VKYFNALPVLEDPQTGGQLDWGYGSPSAYFEDFDSDGRFDIDTEFAYTGASNAYASSTDRVISRALSATGSTFIPLDYVDVTVTTSEGPM
ncbi:MAG TPA: hypothetical protein PKO06_24040, partial [Candidatus Ozemobacteraceae bacterium]|nr:hypothetical protein [Candidatus Ozemobacteraceae bacterium]